MISATHEPTQDSERERCVRETLGPVLVGDLRPHVARGVVLRCAGQLDLVEVGLALARDDVSALGDWLAAGALWRLETEEELALPDGEVWWSVVVRPWVLAQPRTAS